MHHNVDNYTYLTQGPLHRVIIDMAIPTIISMLATGLYNIVDTYFVGKLTTQDTAAVGIVFSLMFFIQAVGFFFGHGSGNYISRELVSYTNLTTTTNREEFIRVGGGSQIDRRLYRGLCRPSGNVSRLTDWRRKQ